MKTAHIIQQNPFPYSIRIVNLNNNLIAEKKEIKRSKKLIRNSTSSVANGGESIVSISKKQFIHNLNISSKEAHESIYWLKLLHAANYIGQVEFENLQNDIKDIYKILDKIKLNGKIVIPNY